MSVGVEKQFGYCSFCRINHNRGKKHVYSKQHQNILKRCLGKFQNKICEAKRTLEMPKVVDFTTAATKQVWCDFCESEVSRHLLIDELIILDMGLLEHITSNEHEKKTKEFFWKNFLQPKKIGEYLLSKDQYKKLQASAELAIQHFEKKRTATLQQEMNKIRQMEAERHHLHQSLLNKFNFPEPDQSVSNQTIHRRPVGGSTTFVKLPGRRTATAFAEGLTFINPQTVNDGVEENMYTGAIPPWLREDVDNRREKIGPVLADYEKHLEQEKKRKLPSNRVGAKFSRTTPSSMQWLPSFGRVWNHGRRLNSKYQFAKEMRRGFISSRFEERHFTSYSDQKNYTPSNPVIITPYKSKKRSETVTFSQSSVCKDFEDSDPIITSKMVPVNVSPRHIYNGDCNLSLTGNSGDNSAHFCSGRNYFLQPQQPDATNQQKCSDILVPYPQSFGVDEEAKPTCFDPATVSAQQSCETTQLNSIMTRESTLFRAISQSLSGLSCHNHQVSLQQPALGPDLSAHFYLP